MLARCQRMVACSGSTTTFEELHGVYVVPPIEWDFYSHHTTFVVDTALRKLLSYDDYCWTIRIQVAKVWEERLRGESLNYSNNNEVEHQYFDFLCCKLEGKELSCKEYVV